jgi:hypothetical protein
MTKIVKFKIEGQFPTELPDNVAEGAINDMLMQHPEKLSGFIEDVCVTIEEPELPDNVIRVEVGPNGKIKEL